MSDIINRIDEMTALLEGRYGAFDDTISWTINQQFYHVLKKDWPKGKRFTPESAEALFTSKYPEGFDPAGGGPKIMPGDIYHADWKALANYWNGGKVMSRNKMDEDVSIPSRIRSKINDVLHSISTKYHKSIPITDIFNALKSQDVLPVQEDGTEWSGLLVGREGRATIDLVRNAEEKTPFKSSLIMSWHKMPSGNYEINAYLS